MVKKLKESWKQEYDKQKECEGKNDFGWVLGYHLLTFFFGIFCRLQLMEFEAPNLERSSMYSHDVLFLLLSLPVSCCVLNLCDSFFLVVLSICGHGLSYSACATLILREPYYFLVHSFWDLVHFFIKRYTVILPTLNCHAVLTDIIICPLVDLTPYI